MITLEPKERAMAARAQCLSRVSQAATGAVVETTAREAAQVLAAMLVAQRLENLIEPQVMESYMAEVRKHL